MRIPGGQRLACLDLHAIHGNHCCAVSHLVSLTLAPVFVLNGYFTITGNNDLLATCISHITHIGTDAQHTIGFTFSLADSCRTRYCTTDVECTHGQLCSRLTDGLCSNNTHCL